MAKHSAKAFVKYALNAYNGGGKYLWGANGEILTQKRLDELHAAYPDQIGESRYQIAKANYIGKFVADCSGLIYGFIHDGARRTTGQLWEKAARRMVLDKNDTSSVPVGSVLYRDGHAGIYIGGGEEIDAMGFDYGIRRRKVTATQFTHYLLFDDFSYDADGGASWLWWLLGGVALVGGIWYFGTSKKRRHK